MDSGRIGGTRIRLQCFRKKYKIVIPAVVGFSMLIYFCFQLDSTNKTKEADLRWVKSIHENSTEILLLNDLTVVTAYFDLGRFRKRHPADIRINSLYRKWMTIFASIDSPLIAFIDKDDDLKFFTSKRSVLPENLTRLIRVNRSQLWSFGIGKRISKIFKSPGYPKHYPDTAFPTYSSAVHSKYAVMQMAIRENPFRTKYFCWLDIGLFRALTSPKSFKGLTYIKPQNHSRFKLGLPKNFSDGSVAYAQVFKRDATKSPKDIVYENLNWVSGAYFVGEHNVLYRWTQEYQNATMTMLANNIMSSDQQVIYSLYNAMNSKTKIQTYIGDGRYDPWFHLGYISRKKA